MVKRSACIKSKRYFSRSCLVRLAAPARSRDGHADRSHGARGHQRLAGRLVAHQLVLEGLPHLLELLRELLLDAVGLLLELPHTPSHPPDLLLELKDALDAREVHAHLGSELLDAAKAIDVLLRVQAGVLRRAPGGDEAAGLVDPQRLRVHSGELDGYRDHVHAAPRIRLAARRHQSALPLPVNSRSRGLPFITEASSSTASFCLRLRERGT